MATGFSRRSFLYGAVVGGFASSFLTYQLLNLDFQGLENNATQQLLFDFINDNSEISPLLGRAYVELDLLEIEATNVNAMAEFVISRLDLQESLTQSQLADAIAEDFRAGNTFEVEDWVFSSTEGQLAALAYLLKGIPDDSVQQVSSTFLDLESLEEAELARLDAWGPDQGQAAQAFNEQPNGNSALWVKLDGLERGGLYYLFFEDTLMQTTTHYSDGLITADLYPGQTALLTYEEGNKTIYLVDILSMKKQFIGDYRVIGNAARPDTDTGDTLIDSYNAEELLRVGNWGPQVGAVGAPFNPQPTGHSALWFQLLDYKGEKYQVYFGSYPMNTHHHIDTDSMTAGLSAEIVKTIVAEKAIIPVHIVDHDRKVRQLVGLYTVR